MSLLTERIIRAAKLDPSLYEEVEADKGAIGQALLVVVLSSLASGVGSVTIGGVRGIVLDTLGSLAGWVIWAYLTYLIGTKLLPEPQTSSNPGELLRTLGFASAPGIIRILGVIPFIWSPVFFIALIWMLLAMVVAIRQALDYKSTLRAVGVAVIGWLMLIVIRIIIFAIIRPDLA
jgi:hypothetical protein